MPKLAADSGDGLEQLLRSSPRLARAAGALAVYEGGRRFYHSTRTWWTDHAAYQVRVTDTDPLYDSVLDWLAVELPSSSNQRRLSVMTRGAGASYDGNAGVPASSERHETSPSKLRVVHTDNQALRLTITGHPVKVRLSAEDGPSGTSSKDRSRFQTKQVDFECRSRAGQGAVMRHLERIHAQRSRRDPALWMANPWGGWDRRNDLPARSIQSVILPPAQIGSIIDDLDGFLAAEERYNELAIPWHRGYLLHGPPGTGKTSLAKALAHHFGLDLWYASLPDLRDGSDLIRLISSVQPKSLLLLEDVDVAIGTHVRPDHDTAASGDGQPVSLAALLNALDGVATPHGLVTVMTTNHLHRLDPALVRAGRMDRVELIDLPGPAEVQALFARFYGEPYDADEVPAGMSQAEVSEIFKRHLGDAAAARAVLKEASTS